MEKIYSPKYSNLIIKDRFILILDNKENRKVCNINSGKTKIGKLELNLKFFENKLVNTFWQVDRAPYLQISQKDFFEEDVSNLTYEEDEYQIENLEKNLKNNKEIYSIGSQKLTSDDIRELKEKGILGDELIKLIMENNTSMEKRTIYSQEKLIKKKKSKHINKIWIADTNLFNIIETFYIYREKNINFMRIDTFSTMLTYSIFSNNASTLLYEDIDNILTQAYASRSSDLANVVSLYSEKIINKNFSIFNLRRKTKNIISYIDYEIFVNESSFYHNIMKRRYSMSFNK